jgi:glycosyltransferase involved in cell wall biosynthesis
LKHVKNILVITYWSLDNALITTYTLPYVRIMLRHLPKGSKVWLVTLSDKKIRKGDQYRKTVADLRQENIESVDFEYRRFGGIMIFKSLGILGRLVTLSLTKRINTVHAWCTPGGAIGYIVSVLTRRQLVLDSFEPHAETMVENGTWTRDSLAFRLLLWLEKKQAKRASRIICAAPGMMEYAKRTYKVNRAEEFIKPACVDLSLFKPALNEHKTENNVVCIYVGKFGGIYLEKETFDFFAAASLYWSGKFRILLLTSHTEKEIEEFCQRSGLDRSIISTHFVPHHEVPRYIASAHFAICPVKPIPTKKYCSPIKDGEYWACGLPVVITANISNDSQIIHENNAGYVLRKMEQEEYLRAAAALDKILKDPAHRERIRALAEKYRNFSIAEKIYRVIYA